MWQSTTTKECAAKPATTEPCPGALTGGPVTVTYGCYNGVWVITGKNIAEVCKNDEVDCVQLVGGSECNYGGNNSSYMYYSSLPSCSNYGLSAGSYVAVGAVSGPFCSYSVPTNPSCVGYLTPGPTKKCKASQISTIKDIRH